MYDPQSLNRYAYIRNNPIRHSDPSGHCGLVCVVFASPEVLIPAAMFATSVVADYQFVLSPNAAQNRAELAAALQPVGQNIDEMGKRGLNPHDVVPRRLQAQSFSSEVPSIKVKCTRGDPVCKIIAASTAVLTGGTIVCYISGDWCGLERKADNQGEIPPPANTSGKSGENPTSNSTLLYQPFGISGESQPDWLGGLQNSSDSILDSIYNQLTYEPAAHPDDNSGGSPYPWWY